MIKALGFGILLLLPAGYTFKVESGRQLSCGSFSYCDYLSGDQYQAMEDALTSEEGWIQNSQCSNLRSTLLAHLWGGQWGRHTSSYGVWGVHFSQYHSSGTTFHFSINQDYDYFNTQNWGLQTRRIQIGGLMLHELQHHNNPGYSESQIDDLVEDCVPDYSGG